MTRAGRQFSYRPRPGPSGQREPAPLLEIELLGPRNLVVVGLVDSGASVSTLPFGIGTQLGLDWSAAPAGPLLGGAFGSVKTRAVVLPTRCSVFPVVPLVFAWLESDDVPVLLGQRNFFLEFDVCFFGAREEFVVSPTAKPQTAP